MGNRGTFYGGTICYLKSDEKVLMMKYNRKWNRVYSPPGGKLDYGESPLDCILREFKEETGLTLVEPKLQGISYWHGDYHEIIFVYVADMYEGELCKTSIEGTLEWIKIDDLDKVEQFEQNRKFLPYLFKDSRFDGHFLLDGEYKVLEYEIREV